MYSVFRLVLQNLGTLWFLICNIELPQTDISFYFFYFFIMMTQWPIYLFCDPPEGLQPMVWQTLVLGNSNFMLDWQSSLIMCDDGQFMSCLKDKDLLFRVIHCIPVFFFIYNLLALHTIKFLKCIPNQALSTYLVYTFNAMCHLKWNIQGDATDKHLIAENIHHLLCMKL